MLHLTRSVLYVPPKETEAETAFSIQKWLLSGRLATMMPDNCNVRMSDRSLQRSKSLIQEVESEIRAFKNERSKIRWKY